MADSPGGADPFAGVYGQLHKIDERLDSLKDETEALNSKIDRMSVPFYRRPGFIGSTAGILILAIGWFWSHFADDPEIPRLVHSNLLMSDRALALTLERGRESSDSPLNRQIEAEIDHMLQSDKAMKEYLFTIAATHGVRTYSGSRIYVRHKIPIGSVRCQILADPELRALILDLAASRRRGAGPLNGSCKDSSGSGATTVVPFIDFAPLVIPFVGRTGDNVQMNVHVLAEHALGDDTPVRLTNGHQLVAAVLHPVNEIEFDPPAVENRLTANVSVPDGREQHIAAIFLNPDGIQKVNPTPGTDGSEPGEFHVSLFATITVTPAIDIGGE